MGELVGTIISQHTSDVNTDRAYANLVATFRTWEAVRDASPLAIAAAIKSAGPIQRQGAAHQGHAADHHRALRPSRHRPPGRLPLPAAKAELASLPGVGPKTAACTLLFALDSRRFRWTPISTASVTPGPDRREGVGRAGPRYPRTAAPARAQVSFDFHILLITHGRRICRAQRPLCPECVLLPECDYGRQGGRPASVARLHPSARLCYTPAAGRRPAASDGSIHRK